MLNNPEETPDAEGDAEGPKPPGTEDIRRLSKMVASARIAMQHVEGMSYESFFADRRTQDAVLYRMTVIGEAAGKVDKKVAKRLTTLPFRDIILMRNHLIHRYWRVDARTVWTTANTSLARMIAGVEQFLQLAEAEARAAEQPAADDATEGAE